MDRDAAPPYLYSEESRRAVLFSPDEYREPPSRRPGASQRAKRRRVAAERKCQDARILVCEPGPGAALATLIRDLHYQVTHCRSLECALREASPADLDVAVLAVQPRNTSEVGLLQLLRRTLPRTPFILQLEDPTPAARLATLEVRPFYVAVPPVGHEEMASALRDAVAQSRRMRGSAPA